MKQGFDWLQINILIIQLETTLTTLNVEQMGSQGTDRERGTNLDKEQYGEYKRSVAIGTAFQANKKSNSITICMFKFWIL